MKRFLVYLCVAIIIVSCGVSIYYVVRNDENIYATIDDERIYMNMGESIDIPVIHERPHRKTTLKVETTSEAISIDEEDWSITACKPGPAVITVTSSNEEFGPFKFAVSVGNGTIEDPYYIRDEQDLKHIGKDLWTVADNYQLVADINLTEEFDPIGTNELFFSGTFSGSEEMYSINNLTINSNEHKVGLFTGIAPTGRVENLIINDAKVTSNDADFTGIIAGKNKGVIGKVIIKDSSVESSYYENNCFTGIIAGDNYTESSYANISLCTVENASIKMASVGGGIVGRNYGGAITNNNIKISDVSFFESENPNKIFGGIAGFTRDGGDAYYSKTGKYTQSVISNNLVIFNRINNSNGDVAGIFGQLTANSINSKGAYSMLIFSTSYAIPAWIKNLNDVELSSKNTTAENLVLSASKNELYKKATYTTPKGSTWNFDTTWSLKEDADLFINYNNKNISYQKLPIEGEIFEITDKDTLKEAISYMRAYPTSSVTYLIKGKYSTSEETDENGEIKVVESGVYNYNCSSDWLPIGTKEQPFRGKIIAENDAIIQISKLKVTDREYAGFFGYTNGAEISNIRVKEAEVTGTAGGAIAGFSVNSIINNCEVIDTKIFGDKYSGSIVGYSNGVISNSNSIGCKVSLNEEQASNIYIGGIVGKAKGKILKCDSEDFVSEIKFESEKNMIFIGGAVGYLDEGYIDEIEIKGLKGDLTTYKDSTIAGGVVGYANASEIRNCSIDDSNLKVNKTSEYSVAGGIIGMLEDGKLLRSSVRKIYLVGYNSAGLVSYNKGNIEECYSGTDARVEGIYVGGLANNNFGNIKNSYSICDLHGEIIEAGLVTFLWKDSSVEYCYTYCKYSGNAEAAYAETCLSFKTQDDKYGTIKNTVIVGDENSKLTPYTIDDFYKIRYILCRDGGTKVGVHVKDIPTVDIKCDFCSGEELIGNENVYSIFNSLNFDKEVWNYENDCIGKSPTLKNIKYFEDFEYGVITEEMLPGYNQPEEQNTIEETSSEEVA